MCATADQVPGLVAVIVCEVPEIGFQTSFDTKVLKPLLAVIPANLYGPQLPLFEDVTHAGPVGVEDGAAVVGGSVGVLVVGGSLGVLGVLVVGGAVGVMVVGGAVGVLVVGGSLGVLLLGGSVGVLELVLAAAVVDGVCTVWWAEGEPPNCGVQPAARPDTAITAIASMP